MTSYDFRILVWSSDVCSSDLFPQLERGIDASPATIRRDLERMAEEGLLLRVRGGAKLAGEPSRERSTIVSLAGVPFHENIGRNRAEKEAIGRAAAQLCHAGDR